MAEPQEDPMVLLQQLRQGTLPPDDTYHVIHEMGRGEIAEAIPDIERFLTHEDAEYRYVALEVLTNHFRLQEHWATAADMLRHDTSEHVRIGAASALGVLKINTHDVPTLRELAQVVLNEAEDESVREAAWSAMRGVINWDWEEQRRLARHGVDLTRQVDWDLVRRYATSEVDKRE